MAKKKMDEKEEHGMGKKDKMGKNPFGKKGGMKK